MPNTSQFRFKSRFPIFFFFFLILVSGTLLGLSTHGFIIDFRQLGFSFVSTFLRGTHGIYSGIAGLVTDIHQNTVLRQEKAQLEEQLADYIYLQQTNSVLRNENDKLKTQIGYMQSLNYVYYPAVIIARDMDVLYTSFTINKGNADGIKKNMPVIAIQDGREGLVGKVIEVSKRSSKIMPIYDYRCNISARIVPTGDIGLLNGMGAFDIPLSLKYVQNTVINEIKVGDMINTSGENENYIRNVPVGRISKISMLDYDSSLSIEVVPVVNFSRLESVFAVDIKESEAVANRFFFDNFGNDNFGNFDAGAGAIGNTGYDAYTDGAGAEAGRGVVGGAQGGVALPARTPAVTPAPQANRAGSVQGYTAQNAAPLQSAPPNTETATPQAVPPAFSAGQGDGQEDDH
ncbi:MAG: hypothetical protein Ta2A_04650 [Treponemataceae bacterium]|nr:MAG: hypothetical protein Ta2A_04650 [Treponemataceae bacterium]